MTRTVLVVDDDKDLRELLVVTLTEAGYNTIQAVDGPQALDKFRQSEPDLVVLDIGLGEMDGLEVCRRIHTIGDTPILFLTSRADEVDQLMGLAVGGDDYITKPFSPRILTARIGAVLRRERHTATTGKSVFEVGTLRLDLNTRTCSSGGIELKLTRIEFDLLSVLMRHPDRVITREILLAEVWGPWFGDQHLIESHISRLRKKIVGVGGVTVPTAVRGVGYKLDAAENHTSR